MATRTRFCDLPDKAVAEIMSRLPPESLVRCKCVQKSWQALIDSLVKTPWFVAKHLQNSETRLFIWGCNWFNFTSIPPRHDITRNLIVTSYDIREEHVQFNVEQVSSFTRPIHVTAVYSSCHCNGVIFQTEKETSKITLCNPTTREFKHLDPDSSRFFGSDFRTIMAGLGYDAIANVYKVVRVVILPDSDGKSASFGAEVYNQDGLCWREIRMIDIGNNPRTYGTSGVYHRGFIYWSLRRENTGSPEERVIISFDVHQEEFQVIPLPSDAVDSPLVFDTVSQATNVRVRVTMGFWFGLRNQCPTLLFYVHVTMPIDTDFQRPVEMWTMNTASCRGGERFSSWAKHANFSLPLKRFYPRAFWDGDELLLSTRLLGVTALCNLQTQKVRTVQLHCQDVVTTYNAIVYVKSLVSLNF